MKRLLSVAFASLLFAATANAQDNKPLYISVTYGPSDYMSITAPNGNQAVYSGAETYSADWIHNDMSFGFEGGAYISSGFRMVVAGGFSRTVAPGHSEYIGTANGVVPSYDETPNRASNNFLAQLGADVCFGEGNVKPFVGLRGRGAYGYNEIKYNNVASMGKSVAETWNIGGAVVFGADYHFEGGLMLGCQFDLFSYTYGGIRKKPQPGLAANEGSCQNIGFIALPTIKLGFNF